MKRRRPRRMTRAGRCQCGSALVEVTWLTILLLVPLVYVVLGVFEVQRASYAVTAATRAAGRAFVLAPDTQTAQARAVQAADVALRDQDLDLPAAALVVTCEPAPTACLQPGSVAVVSLELQVALPLLPAVLGGQTPSVRVSSMHRSPYGTYREARP